MKRERVEERFDLVKDFDMQQYVLSKSDDRCCHCGKKYFFPFGATIDHFVPLSKGGTNRKHNLIMLCHNCNQEKGNDIKELSYIPYLLPKYREELADYYHSYRDSFEYISRNRLLSADEYNFVVESKVLKAKKKASFFIGKSYNLKIVKDSDRERVEDYFEKYCKKHDITCYRELIEIQIALWQKFAVMYYMEDTAGSIQTLIVMLLSPIEKEFEENVNHCLKMYIFSYYTTELQTSIVCNIISELPKMVCEEQHIPMIPVTASIPYEDNMYKKAYPLLVHTRYIYLDPCNRMFYNVSIRIATKDRDKLLDKDKNSVVEFIKKFGFSNTEKAKLKKYLKSLNSEDMTWVYYDLLSPEDLREVFEKGSKDYLDNELLIKDNNNITKTSLFE